MQELKIFVVKGPDGVCAFRSALEAEEQQAEAREDRHRQEMSAMEQRVKQLEKSIERNTEGTRNV